MKNTFHHFLPCINKAWPYLFIFLIWFVFSSPYFLKGLVPYPSKYQVTFFHPWSAFEKWWGPVKNNAMPDIISQIYPWKHFTIEAIKNGQIPAWNPYSFAGNPHIGNFQSAVFSPFNLLFFVLPFLDAWSIMVLLQPLLSGIFTYLFLRELNISKNGSLIACVTFMFCGFNVVWMAYGTLSLAIAFLPLALFGIEKAYFSNKSMYFLLVTISLVASFFSGHIQTSVYLAGIIFLYLVFRFITHRSRILLIKSMAYYMLGIIVVLVQVYPTYILYQNSVRSESLHLGGGIPFNYMITVLAPDFYGNPVTRNDWFGTYAEWSSFVGIIPLFLAITAFLYNRNKYVLFFGLTSIGSLLLALDSPLHNILIASKIPILATSIPSRIIVIFSFSVAVLSGFGIDYIESNIKKGKFKKIFTVLLSFALLLLLIWGLLFSKQSLPVDKVSIAIKNLILPTLLLLVMGMIIVSNKFVSKKFLLTVSCFLLLVLVSFDSLRFASKWMPFDPRNLVFPNLPVIKAMQKNIGFGRVFGNIGTEVTTYYGLSSVEGYDPLYIKRYGEFLRFATDGTWQEAERSVARLDRRSKFTHRALDLLGVNIIYHPISDTNTAWAFPVWEDYEKYSVIYQDDKFQLYRNNTALPRIGLFYDYEVITEKEKILKRVYSDAFDIRKTIVLEKQPGTSRDDLIDSGSGTAKIVKYTPNEVNIEVNSNAQALLYLSDNYYGSWRVYINGKNAELLRANYTFKAVIVPKGKSSVEFIYKEYF